MFSNNPKIASFYPTSKRPNNSNYFNQFSNPSLTTPTNTNNNISFLSKDEPINFQDKSISPSVELALITVNLSSGRFKTMSREELDNYVKTAAYNNSYDSRKYLLALNILNSEIDKNYNHIIKQQLQPNKIEKSHFEKAKNENRINMNDMICIESDEFKLNTFITDEFADSSSMCPNFISQSASMTSNNMGNMYSTSNNNSNSNSKFIKQNRNLDMSTYSGNPMGSFRITNNNPGNSFRPINQIHKSEIDITSNQDNMSTMSTMSNMSNVYNNTNLTNKQINQNNIIQQSSMLSNPLNFQINGGRRRTSNLDVGSSDNYVIIK
jgi:hypothetical protein